MALVGNYDASTFVPGTFATYPQLPSGSTLYQPTMHWRVSVAGTVQGQAVEVGDLLFATQGSGRLFGDGNYGDQIFGGISDGGWTVGQVLFLRWVAGRPAPDLDPFPNAGCPFTRADQAGGDWAPGWRIVIDAYYNNPEGSRTYGTGLFGGDVFGDVDDAGGLQWVDLTRAGYRIETGDGTVTGSQRVPVSEVVIDLIDEDGSWFDIAEPATWYQPQPGTPLRVGLISPDFAYHPVIVGEIERIEDIHDDQHPRIVTVRAFGRIMDLTVDVYGVQRPYEVASERMKALVPMAGWTWDEGNITVPFGDAPMLADLAPRDIVVRDELDRIAQACGWLFDSDRRGRMRLRTWPHEPVGDTVTVVDCWDEAAPDEVTDHRLAPSMTIANDQSSLLNHLNTSNTESPTPTTIMESNALSVSRFGRRGRALDYPKPGLPWAFADVALVWVRRVVNRFAFITRHIEQFDVDTDLDPGWLPVLADLDACLPLSIERRAIDPVTLDALVVGWRHIIEPGRWRSTIFTTTTTSSM